MPTGGANKGRKWSDSEASDDKGGDKGDKGDKRG